MTASDAPTANLHSRTGPEILGLIRSMTEAGRTFLITTHDGTVAEIAHRVVRRRDGEVVEVIERGGSA